MSGLRTTRFINRILGRPNKLNFPGKRSKPKLGPRGKLLTVAAISFTVHGGAVFMDSLIRYLNRPSPSLSLPMVEDAEKIAETERKILLDKLKTEKMAFLQQLLENIHKNTYGPISDFALKSEMLDKNIEALESGSGEIIDEKEMRDRYQALLRHAKKWAGKYTREKRKIGELHHFSHHRVFRGYLKASADIINVLLNGVYNCTSSTKFLTALEDDLVGSGNFGVIVLDPPAKGKLGHMLSWYREGDKYWQMENTDGGPPRIAPFEKGLRTPKEIFIAAYLINNGIKPSQLPERIGRYYKGGIGEGGFPVAGVSTDLPKPPDGFIPNPYFGIKNPKPLAASTLELYEKMQGGKEEKPLETGEIIKEAKIDAMALSLFQTPQRKSGPIILSSFEVPKGVDWCKLADFKDSYRSDSDLFGYRQQSQIRFRYLTAIKMAEVLSGLGDKRFRKCAPEAEYRKFKKAVKMIIEKQKFKKGREHIIASQLLRGLSYPEKAKRELLEIIKSIGKNGTLAYNSMSLLAIIGSPEDFDFFKSLFWENARGGSENSPNLMGISSAAMLNLRPESKDLAQIFLSAFAKVDYGSAAPYGIRDSLLCSLGKFGYGAEVLKLLNKQDNFFQLNRSRDIVSEISRLYPDKAAEAEDIQRLRDMIENRKVYWDYVLKVKLIALLANEGRMEEALEYVEGIDRSELEKYFESKWNDKYYEVEEKKEFIISLGKINSPEIGKILLSQFLAYPEPELTIAIGQVFLDCDFYSNGSFRIKIAKELKRIMNNDFYTNDQRQRAALLLIQMGAH